MKFPAGSKIVWIESQAPIFDRPGAWLAWVRRARPEDIRGSNHAAMADFSF